MHKKIMVMVAFIATLFPLPAFSAGLLFSEIMFDPVGVDTGREWVRLSKVSDGDLDLKDILLLEEGVKHKIATATSSLGIVYQKIPAGKDIVIADNPQKFILEYPEFDGAVFDSVFSLKNSGENLSLLFKGEVVDDFTAPAPFLESGDGKVWARSNGIWTLGSSALVPLVNSQPEGQIAATTTNYGVSAESEHSEWIEPDQPQIKVSGSFTKIQTAGVEGNFQALAFGKEGEMKSGVRYYWNFGNGETAEGEKVLHTYLFPGKFAVSVTAVSDRISATDYKSIDIFEPKIEIASLVPGKTGWLELRNLESRFVELSGFIILTAQNGQKVSFSLPSKTFLAPNGHARISASSAGMSFSSGTEILYPNGRFLTRQLIK